MGSSTPPPQPQPSAITSSRVRIFVDYWNFHARWRDRTSGADCDWKRLPGVFLQAASQAIAGYGIGALTLEEVRVYASVAAGRDAPLKRWLTTFLDRQPGVRVFTATRHSRRRPVHCRECNTEHADCPSCGKPFTRAVEKGVDTAIVTDLMSLAWEGAYDIALLVSGDADFIPAVERLQEKNIKVVNASWKKHGFDLARTAWAHFDIDEHIPDLTRTLNHSISTTPLAGSTAPRSH